MTLDDDYAITFKIFGQIRKVFLEKGINIQVFNHSPVHYYKIVNWSENCGLSLAFIHTTPERNALMACFSLKAEKSFL